MTDKYVRERKYQYTENASKVVQREKAGPITNLPSGESESLVGRKLKPFGDLVSREENPELKKLKEEAKVRVQKKMLKEKTGVDKISKESRAIYNQIVTIVQRHMSEVSYDILKEATGEVLAILKTDNLKDIERKQQIECFIDSMNDNTFNELTVLAAKITDLDSDFNTNAVEGQETIMVDVDLDQEGEGSDSDRDDVYAYDPQVENNKAREDAQMDEAQDLKVVKTGEDGVLFIESELQNFIKNQKDANKIISSISADKARMLIKYYTVITQLDGMDIEKEQYQEKVEKAKDELFSDVDCRLICEGLEGETYKLESAFKRILANFKKDSTEESEKIKSFEINIDQDFSLDNERTISIDFKEGAKTTEAKMQHFTKNILDLNELKFENEGHTMSNDKCSFPKGSYKVDNKGYEEVYIPAVTNKASGEERLIPLSELPEWTQWTFPEKTEKLNRIQSKVYKAAFESPENLLICAPTGAGKTNIAMLTILHTMGWYKRRNDTFDTEKFKIIYIAPMKALVSEVVGNFNSRLKKYGIVVKELTGDVQLTKKQIEETQIIVTTPEKWDIVTRKAGDRAYVELVKLVIIDEIHLLHDSRGPVLETVVARTIRQIETTGEAIRIVGLSATLPNYMDVAAILRVKPNKGLFFFNSTFRPVPLEQIYVGITEKKQIKRLMLSNEICYNKVIERAGKHQILVFVHSRKETVRTAKLLRDTALEKDEIYKIMKDDAFTKEVLKTEGARTISNDVKDLLPFGIGIHHAGLPRDDRKMIEDLFAQKHIQILVSTATLAWGVNLPAHTVIIKGTQIYNPEKGRWTELSPQDILQMMGRAGRPQYDKTGEGIIITSHQELKYYLSLNNMQLPIESQFISQLADQLNAEVVMGTVSNLKDGVNWLAYTYLYVRMLRSPEIYGLTNNDLDSDPLLTQRRTDLIHTAAILLDRSGLIRYDKKTGAMVSTPIGKVASHYYIKYESMGIYNKNLKPTMGMIDIFRLFSLSNEFLNIPVRENEKIELNKFIEKVPVPVKGSIDEPATKINILLQVYISKFKTEGYDLNADMVYVTQSAGRIMRALFEIALKKGWSQLAQQLLKCCKMVEVRLWPSMTPLRQFSGIKEEVLKKIEKKEQFTWEHFYNMSPQEIGEVLKFQKLGKTIHRLIHKFPRLEMKAFVQPLTRSCIKIGLEIKLDFQWDETIHGRAETFHIFVEDVDGEMVHWQKEIISNKDVHSLSFTVALQEPLPPYYYIRAISDRWLRCETVLPVSFKTLILPDKFPPPTEKEDIAPIGIESLKWNVAIDFYEDKFKEFNTIQSQVFGSFYESDESIFLGAPTSSGKTACAEMAILRQFRKSTLSEDPNDLWFGKIVYIAHHQAIVDTTYEDWQKRFKSIFEDVEINKLTGILQTDLTLLKASTIILATAEQWDVISRRWTKRANVQNVSLFIIDEIHLMNEPNNLIEIVVSRMRYMAMELRRAIRFIALGTSIANYKVLSEWLGASKMYNFMPSNRPLPLEISIRTFDHNIQSIRLLSMSKPAYQSIRAHSDSKPVIIFVPDRKHARLISVDLISFATSDDNPNCFLGSYKFDRWDAIKEDVLKKTMKLGVGYLHEGLSKKEKQVIKHLFELEMLKVLVVVHGMCWDVGNLNSYMTIILDPVEYDYSQSRCIEYPMSEILQMIGRASRPSVDSTSRCEFFWHTPLKDYFYKFIAEPLPVESNLEHVLHDTINAEVVVENIESQQDVIDWITWTFMYRRLVQNPNYYNLNGKTGNHINDHLSELIEKAVDELSESGCIKVNEDQDIIESSNLGKIAAYYNIKHLTIKLFDENLNENRTMKHLLEIISSAEEFENLPIRESDESQLRHVKSTEYRVDSVDGIYSLPNVKTNILLQCHFSRTPLSIDLSMDQKKVLEMSLNMVHAMVDVISSNGWLKPALLTMELSQMIVQASFAKYSTLFQLPHFDYDLIERCANAGINDISDLMEMDDEPRIQLLNMNQRQLEEVAQVCNSIPSYEIKATVQSQNPDEGKVGEDVTVAVTISKDDEDDDSDEEVPSLRVYAPYYPKEKEEQWWLVIADERNNRLMSIKKVQPKLNSEVEITFTPSESGNFKYTAMLIWDSYIGCDVTDKFGMMIYAD